MQLFWWQKLLLLVLIQLLPPNRTSHEVYGEALLIFKTKVDHPEQSRCTIVNCPWLRLRHFECVNCYDFKDPGAIPLNVAKLDGENDVPTLTPMQEAQVNKQGNKRVAVIVGGVVAALIVIFIVMIIYKCWMLVKKFVKQTSETASSVPSPPIEQGRDNTSLNADAPPQDDRQTIRQLTIYELEEATRYFSLSNVIGEGRFGLIFKGLLQDGSVVAIKRRLHAPNQDFVSEVQQIAHIHHSHLVKLLGYFQDSYQQLLVYDYLPNGNVGKHLYDSKGLPIGKLGMHKRFLIALGAAKGLEHLHSLVPPVVHTHFRTGNVLVDEDFTAKVTDYGLSKIIISGDHPGASSYTDCFVDPELNSSRNFSEKSDVYSFGVFMLELISGHAAKGRNQSNLEENLVLQVKNSSNLDKFVEKLTLADHTLHSARQVMGLALLCLDMSYSRPSMRRIVQVLEMIQERETGHFHSQSEEIGPVTLGSELFK
ncbi:Pkinase_Tyr domain-containing protein [Quillaja saponaria]|uniref:non-specific serine/threonine protein kinase n=1 Tax=Quillaja saponaria TaxID=32244 RepID=A0AAD7VM28_QUISA|nr:Pkinase_Tyr domain-containing protein [Quillaja saponaria]